MVHGELTLSVPVDKAEEVATALAEGLRERGETPVTVSYRRVPREKRSESAPRMSSAAPRPCG